MVSVSAECRPLYGPRYLPIVGRYVDHHSADISVDTSVDMSTDTSPSTYQPTLDQYVDRHTLGQYADRHIGRVSVGINGLRCRPIYQLRGAQDTHDPKRLQSAFCFQIPFFLFPVLYAYMLYYNNKAGNRHEPIGNPGSLCVTRDNIGKYKEHIRQSLGLKIC